MRPQLKQVFTKLVMYLDCQSPHAQLMVTQGFAWYQPFAGSYT